MYPLDATECLKQLKTFNPPKEKKAKDSLPALLRTLTKPMEVETQIDKWETKFSRVCSSPSRPDWHSFVKGTKQVLVRSKLQKHELRIHQERRIEEQERKVTSRKVLQKFGGLTARDA
jgi:hypothetical protein